MRRIINIMAITTNHIMLCSIITTIIMANLIVHSIEEMAVEKEVASTHHHMQMITQ